MSWKRIPLLQYPGTHILPPLLMLGDLAAAGMNQTTDVRLQQRSLGLNGACGCGTTTSLRPTRQKR